LALFLAKNHNPYHAFFSRRMSPALGKRGMRRNERWGKVGSDSRAQPEMAGRNFFYLNRL
jgi:hypothetical protein